jgi:soluble lytic murein transglycosylase
MVDAVDDFNGPLFNLDAFLKVAALCDNSDYFADVLEEALVKIGCRQNWTALERYRQELAPVLPAILRWRSALVLARVRQLEHPFGLDTDPGFQEMTHALSSQTDSLYYQMLARWMRGEPVDIGGLLSTWPGQVQFSGAERDTDDPAVLNWAETVAEGYWSMGMLDPGMEFAWDHRSDLGMAWFTRLGSRYVAAGRYRQGLKILDSVRLRAGHPDQPALLEWFYPRAYSQEMTNAVAAPAALVVPEWLMFALTRTESLFDNSAQSGPGAQGLAQLMPETARSVAKGLRINEPDLADPATNLRLGAVYLADQFRALGQWPQSLAAYNAGASRVRAWQKAGLGTDPILFSELIPFEETRNYVRRITESAAIYAWLYYRTDAGSTLSIVYTPASTYRQ